MSSSSADLQMQRGAYLNGMALADELLTVWFFQRLGVSAEQRETFFRLVDTGTLGSRIELFQQLDDSPRHKKVAKGLEGANKYRNVLAHGNVVYAADPNSSMVRLGEWEVEQWRRKGLETKSISAAEIEAERRKLTDVLNELKDLILALPRP
jgi:hypothetical protein